VRRSTRFISLAFGVIAAAATVGGVAPSTPASAATYSMHVVSPIAGRIGIDGIYSPDDGNGYDVTTCAPGQPSLGWDAAGNLQGTTTIPDRKAGPLVNVALLPVLALLSVATSGLPESDVHAMFRAISYINIGLLFFNLLPVYPLDGGQILGALLWFVIGRARSLMVTAVIGLVGVAALGWWALNSESAWLGLIAFFLGSRCIASFQAARLMSRETTRPRPPGRRARCRERGCRRRARPAGRRRAGSRCPGSPRRGARSGSRGRGSGTSRAPSAGCRACRSK